VAVDLDEFLDCFVAFLVFQVHSQQPFLFAEDVVFVALFGEHGEHMGAFVASIFFRFAHQEVAGCLQQHDGVLTWQLK
jgi:hypothetical protein